MQLQKPLLSLSLRGQRLEFQSIHTNNKNGDNFFLFVADKPLVSPLLLSPKLLSFSSLQRVRKQAKPYDSPGGLVTRLCFDVFKVSESINESNVVESSRILKNLILIC